LKYNKKVAFKCYVEIMPMKHWKEVFLKRSFTNMVLNENCYIINPEDYEEIYQKIRPSRIFNNKKTNEEILNFIGIKCIE
jgi:hypothetical protein